MDDTVSQKSSPSAFDTLPAVKLIADTIRANIARVMVGKDEIIDLLLVALFSDGHVLLEDVPGMGKTMMTKALASSLSASFQRIQGTPDLLPAAQLRQEIAELASRLKLATHKQGKDNSSG